MSLVNESFSESRAIKPTDNKLLAIITIGEGWHNYHHIFPWDYKAAELGNYAFNLTTGFIDFFAWIGKCFISFKRMFPYIFLL